jgi:hypothetical protein
MFAKYVVDEKVVWLSLDAQVSGFCCCNNLFIVYYTILIIFFVDDDFNINLKIAILHCDGAAKGVQSKFHEMEFQRCFSRAVLDDFCGAEYDSWCWLSGGV